MASLIARMLTMTCLAAGAVAAPAIYHTRDLQSPARATGGDLLQLSGANLDPAAPVWIHALDTDETAAQAQVVRDASDSGVLILRMPEAVKPDRRYAIGIGEPDRNDLTINDARPAWFLPTRLPVRGEPPGLTREIRIVGRNLDAAAGAAGVRLTGPRDVLLSATPDTDGIGEFLVRATVPEDLPAGEYQVAVNRGSGWVTLGKPLSIEHGIAPENLDLGDAAFGGCRPDDGRDDTACLLKALAAAAPSGHTTIHLASGEWLLDDIGHGVDRREGILLPPGVGLMGDSAGGSRLHRGPAWTSLPDASLLTLAGSNLVADLTFTMSGTAPGEASFLQIGRQWQSVPPRTAEHITLTHNVFRGAPLGVRSGGLPVRDLVITRNRFQARRLGLAMGGDSRNTGTTFRIEDAVVRWNLFEPGSYLDAAIGQGSFASEFGAAERLDFSANLADGVSIAALDTPRDARGWRAAFFWHLQGPQEQLLISANEISCSGDKAGDGEAIALDNNHNSFAFTQPRTVLAADASHVSVAALPETAPGIDPTNYFVGHWLQIAEGRGVGQSRRIVAVSVDALRGRSAFVVNPAWDVIPEAGASRIMVGRAFWQALIVGNRIEHRSPPCAKSNRSSRRGGSIGVWAQSTDSVVAFNRQFDTNGITVQHMYGRGGSFLQYFLEIRGNQVSGDYDSRSPDGRGVLMLSEAATPERPPPVAGFGETIAHNTFTRPRDAPGAAINVIPTWYIGPAPHRWPLIDRVLVFGNSLNGGTGGLNLSPQALLGTVVLSANRCQPRARAPQATAFRLVRVCEEAPADDCACGGK